MSLLASQPAGGVSLGGALQAPAGGANGLCIFDIDSTLTRNKTATEAMCGEPLPDGLPCIDCIGNKPPEKRRLAGTSNTYPAPYGLPAVNACMDMGYQVAIATARACDGGTVKNRLTWMAKMGYPDSLVTPDGKPGPNFTCGASASDPDNVLRKSSGIKMMMNKYSVPAEKTIFFDDTLDALVAAKKDIPKLNIQLASRNCGGQWCPNSCGLTKKEFDWGIARTTGHPPSNSI